MSGYKMSFVLVLGKISSPVYRAFCEGFLFECNKNWGIYMSNRQSYGSRVMNRFSVDVRSNHRVCVLGWF